MSKKHLVIFAAAFIGSTDLMAQDSSRTKQLDEVVVTATKFPLKQSLTGKVITVITKEQLQKSSGRSIGEILNTQAGLTIIGAQNTLGTNLDVYLRGAGSGKTLILIDGIPSYDPSVTSTAFDLNLFSVDQVERIEILKGSQSTLYGSDAVAGVINIITKKGSGKPLNVSANLSAGSFGTYKTSVGVNGKVNKTGYNVQYTKLKSDGISTATDKNSTGTFDRDGFDQDVFLANISQQISSKLQLRANTQYSKTTTDLDAGAFTDDNRFTFGTKNTQAGVGADYTYKAGTLHVNYNYNLVKRTYIDDSIVGNSNYSKGEYEGKSHFAEAYTNIALQKNIELLVGADYRKQITDQHYLSISSFGPFKTDLGKDSAKDNQFGAYTSVVFKNLGGFNLEVGGRFNSFHKYGNVFTYSINPSFVINDEVKLFANLSSGFKAPTLYQLYSEYRNPTTELKPEKSVSFDGGVQYSKNNVNLRAVYFVRSVKDNLVFYSQDVPPYASYYINTDKQKDHGFELEASTVYGALHLNANFTNVKGKVSTTVNGKDTSFNNLYRRPQNTLNLNVGVDVCKDLFVNLGLRTVSDRQEAIYASAPVVAAAYYTLNAYADYKLGKHVKLFADLKNLTNETYYDVRGYNSKGFNFMAGVNLNF